MAFELKCRFIILTVLLPLVGRAENIEGTIVVKKQLTKRRVTASVPLYQRGQGVALATDSEADPLAAERSRVVIWLEGSVLPSSAGTQAMPRPEVVKMTQENRSFTPDTVVVTAGDKVSFPNLDPIFHNVFSLSKPKTFDLGSYSKGDSRTVVFPVPGIVYVNCHLHPNMTAVIVITPNQWRTKADRAGRFDLNEVPRGKYTIVAWHKAAGFFRHQIQIEAGQDAKVEFLIPIDVDGSRLDTRR